MKDGNPEDGVDALLSGSSREGKTPLTFCELTKLRGEKESFRLTESSAYRTRAFRVFGVGKPISKPFQAVPKNLPVTGKAGGKEDSSVRCVMAMDNSMLFCLYACCVPVRGARRSLICDLQRNIFRFIPNALFELLTDHKDKTFTQILDLVSPSQHQVVREYFGFLEENEFGFWTDEPENFPPISLNWERPELIYNAIVDIDTKSEYDLAEAARQLEEVGCKFLQVRFFGFFTLADLMSRIKSLGSSSRLRWIEIIAKFSTEFGSHEIDEVCCQDRRISRIFLYSASETKHVMLSESGCSLHFRTDEVLDSEHCGEIHRGYFSPTYECFIEAQRYNTCLNRKISIDCRGEVRNCPAMKASYGSIKCVTLKQAANHNAFQAMWSISKDHVLICQDCEFRYICTDCRAFVENSENIYSKPAKCRYNPYSATWDE